MSIWVSHGPVGGDVRSCANGWSNHYPTTDGTVERPAAIDLASIPTWCVPGHDLTEGRARGPWLRLGVFTARHDFRDPRVVLERLSANVVMDESAVRDLVAQLTDWLDTPKVHPTTTALRRRGEQ